MKHFTAANVLVGLFCVAVLVAIGLVGSEHRIVTGGDRHGCVVTYEGTGWTPRQRVISTICPTPLHARSPE